VNAAGFWRVVRFGVAGGASLVVDVALQRGLREGLGLPIWVAPAISYELGLLAHFFLLTWWVFRQEVTWGRLVKFHVTAAGAAAITLGVTYGLLTQPLVPYFADVTGPLGSYGPEAAKLLGTATAMGWTFLSSFFWVWRPARAGADPSLRSG
jgi:putative flippase GtrA